MQSLVVSLVSAFGPTLMGLTVDATGSYRLEVALIALLFGSALAILLGRGADTRRSVTLPTTADR